MQPIHIQVALQAVTVVIFLGGLVYTARQFRQHRRAQHMANFMRLVELQMQLRRLRVDNPALAKAHTHDVEGLETDQAIQEYFLNLMQLSVFEIVWFAHRQGQIPNDYFESWLRRMREIAREDSFKRMMAKPSTKIMHDEFQAFVELVVRGT